MDTIEVWGNLCELPRDHALCKALASHSHTHDIAAGEALIHQGETPSSIYVLITGQLGVFRYSRRGHEIWIADIAPYELVGEIGAVLDAPRSSNVQAIEPSKIISVSTKHYKMLLNDHPEFAMVNLKLLSERLMQSASLVESLVSLNVPSRLYFELLKTGERVTDDDELIEIASPPKIKDLAIRIHSTREATSRTATELERRGVLDRSSKTWRIVEPKFE